MGLTQPSDLRAWRRWQEGQHPLRTLRGRLRRTPARGTLYLGGPEPDVLVALDSTSPSNTAALLAPVEHLPRERVAVLAPTDAGLDAAADWPRQPWSADRLDRNLDTVRVVASAGHYLPLGGAGFALATSRALPFVTVQHGLLTPHAPPLAPGTALLAWSSADADFWRSDRDDVTARVVGSQLLWHAAAGSAGDADVPREPDAAPTYLGQLHGAELARPLLVEAAGAFCRATGATYRPHPSERDRRSRRQHERWESEGIAIDRSGVPLDQLRTPVVSVFSTGVVEAAARGVPAWVDLPEPPEWLVDFWLRYRMARWGGDEPTPAPDLPPTPPARAVADTLLEMT